MRTHLIVNSSVVLLVIFGCGGAASADDYIKNGSFGKNADGWTNQVQGIDGVVSEWLEDGGRDGSGALHVRSEKDGPQSIWIWRNVLTDFPKDKSLRISGWAKGKDVENLVAICVQGWDADHKKIISFATTQNTNPLKGDFDWTRIETIFTPSPETKQVHILIFISGKGEVWFDNVSAEATDRVEVPSVPGAPTASPGLFEARGEYKLSFHAKTSKPTILIPLPLCYREQVPLTY